MFRPFFLNRKINFNLHLFIGKASHEYVTNPNEIDFIAPERLKILPCNKLIELKKHSEGIPFNLPATISLLTHTKPSVMDYIITNTSLGRNQTILLFCPGSNLNGELPYIIISPQYGKELQVCAAVPCQYKTIIPNAFQLRYKP